MNNYEQLWRMKKNRKESKEEVGDILNTIFLYKHYSDYRISKEKNNK